MRKSVEWMVGGQQGEGIDSTGDIFSKALVRSGYFSSTFKHFMSRIKGGHTNYKIRATTEMNFYSGEKIDILLCLDKETLPLHETSLSESAVVIREGSEINIIKSSDFDYVIAEIPLSKIASDLGNPLAKNMVALGMSAALCGLSNEVFYSLIEEIFEKKSKEIIQSNIKSVEKGYELVSTYLSSYIVPLETVSPTDTLFISGNEATAFGSLMAGCRYLSAYPITPASEVMEWLSQELPSVGGTVMQVEDEIAGICFAIGASYAGARAMTSTSGPGLSLKTEALGMAAMAEVPIVIVNSQRGGPSTGLPTKHEQSDLQHMIYGTHGEIPRIVLYPATIQDAFYVASEAFNLADTYQCPVIIALDLGLSMNKMTVPSFDISEVEINRGKLLSQEEVNSIGETHFKRYRFTEDGISPRPIPGQINGVHTTSSNEHNELGYISEDTENRVKMMNKRMEKINTASLKECLKISNPEAEVLLVGMGSTFGVIQETIEYLKNEGLAVGHVHIQQIHPLPVEKLESIFGDKKIITVENNYNGQLLNWLRQHLPIHKNSHTITQFDGNPFAVSDVINKVKGLL